MAKTTHIEIVRSTIPALSSLSQVSCDAIEAVLAKRYTVGVTVVNTQQDLESLVAKRPDLVFSGMKYVPGNLPGGKFWLSTYLDQQGIAYTGSGQVADAYEVSKPLAKQRILDMGLKTAKSIVLKGSQIVINLPLEYPLFVKPASLGGGQGVDDQSVVYTPSQLHFKIAALIEENITDVLIEEYLPGREFSVAILRKADSMDYHILPIELMAPANFQGNRILGRDVKSGNQEAVSLVSDVLVRDQVNELALNVFHALGARDYGRIDIRLDANGVPHFLEANLVPSLIEDYGSFPKACFMNLGYSQQEVICAITELGLLRAEADETMALPLVLVT